MTRSICECGRPRGTEEESYVEGDGTLCFDSVLFDGDYDELHRQWEAVARKVDPITAILDAAVVPPGTLAERVRLLVAQRDRAVQAEGHLRDSHKATVKRCTELAEQLERLMR
jgi:hypothetical protein